MAKGIPLTDRQRELIIHHWNNGALTYEEVFFATNIPISTVRLVIDKHLKKETAPQKIKASRGIQLKLI